MAHYHFTIIQRMPEHRIMLSYMETIESLMWALCQLGHEVSFSFNEIRHGATNVISNLGLLTLNEVMALPKRSVFLNLEQRLLPVGPDYRALTPKLTDADQRLRWERLLYTVDHHSFWDYSAANLALIESLKPAMPHYHVPIGWSPTLEKVPQRHTKDFDVIFFGSMSANRQLFFESAIKGKQAPKGFAPHVGLSLLNVFGPVRDEMLARSRIAIHAPKQLEQPEIFGIVRCAYLMANRIPVIAQAHADMREVLMEPDILGCVRFCSAARVYDALKELLEDPISYERYADQLYACIRARDLVGTLCQVVGSS